MLLGVGIKMTDTGPKVRQSGVKKDVGISGKRPREMP